MEKITISLLSLQKGGGSGQLADCSFRHRFVGCQEEINQTWDFVETASIIANCDLVVTCDTAVAHLAAGMGRPTWLLLTKVPEWRWGMTGDTSFWYPSMRLFRQREQGNWAEVMDRVATALQAFVNNPKLPPGQPDKLKKVWREKEQQAVKQLQQGHLEEAEVIYRTLIEEGATSHTIFHSLAFISWKQGRKQEAISLFRQAIAINPNHPEAHRNLGIALHEQADLEAAIDAYRQALAMQPHDPDTYNKLGNALKDQGDLQAAVDVYQQALAINPDFFGAYNNLGIALKEQGNLQAAVDAYQQALAINPNYSEAHSNLGNALREQGNLPAAIDAYRQALAINPDFSQAYNNLGSALRIQGDPQGAIHAYRQALAISPNFPDALSNLGSALEYQGDLQAAMDAYRQALAINPNFPDAHWNLSLLQLLSGDYGHGWEGYEWRFQAKKVHQLHLHPQMERWHGGNLAPGERLIIVSEQGLGDTLQFMRYVLHLNNTGQPASLCTETKLHGLIRASGITTTIYSFEQAKQLTTGKWFPLLSLPGYLQVRPDHPIVDTPYIKAPEQQVEHWQQKLATEQRPIVGINWQGNPKTETISLRGRSLPLESFAPIAEKTAVTLLSLQKGDGADQLADCSFRHRFVGCQEEINQTWDFVETAAIIANCDLIITSDTAVAHLAAGMGHPTWLLLTTVPDWRWGMTGDTSFWYPSMRLFRQREQGNWAEVMDRVARALAAEMPAAAAHSGQVLKNQADPQAVMAAYHQASVLLDQGDLQGAVAAYGQVLAMKPDFPEAQCNLGNALKDQGDLQGAVAAYGQALATKPDFPEAQYNLGNALQARGDLPGAVAAYRQALASKPDFPEAQHNLGIALQTQGDLSGAVAAYRQALASKPHDPGILSNLGNALQAQGDLQGAVAAYGQALASKPDDPAVLSNLGTALQRQGNLQEAMAAYHQALASKPDFCRARSNLSTLQLLLGDYKRGWQGYESRFLIKLQDVNNKPLPLETQLERWNGDNLAPGEELIIVSEGGLGDTLHFMRYVLYLNNTGQSASLCTETKLHGLIRSSGITTEIYSAEQGNQLTAGKWLSLLSLPGYLQVRPDHPVVDTPYIKAPEQRVGHWQQKLATEQRPIIGINWSGNRKSALSGKGEEDWRSLPLESFAPIAEKTSVSLLCLQKGHGADQLADCSFRHRFVGCQEEINQIWDFVETAAMIANCDLVVTCDTAVAHLAAGMGRPTWLLLTKVPEWRWGMTGETSFWYPSMRLFRQRERGNWAEVMDRVARALAAEMPAATAHSGHALKSQAADPQAVMAAYHQASALQNQGDLQGAVAAYGQVLAMEPDFPEAQCNLGTALKDQGDLPGAVAAYRQALASKPDFPEAQYNLGNTLQAQGDVQGAVAAYGQALASKPDFPEAQHNLGIALQAQGDVQGAVAAYGQALASKPHDPGILSNLGNALQAQGDLQGAVAAYGQALAGKPDDPGILSNLGTALQSQGNLQEAMAAFHQALASKPDFCEARFNLSLLQLLLGNHERGWPGYESRFLVDKLKNVNKKPLPLETTLERWNGDNLAPGEELILVSEQGLGDTLQFMRYAIHLKNRGILTSLCVPDKLRGLVEASGITETIYSRHEELEQCTTGKWYPLLSLPGYLQVRPDHPIIDTPYIQAPEQRIRDWQQKLAGEPGPVVAINWQGNLKIEKIALRGRSLPLESFAPIAEKTTVSLLSLQKGDGAEQLADCPFRHRFVSCQEEINQTWDFVETAAMIAQLRSRHHLRHCCCPLGSRDGPPHLAAAHHSAGLALGHDGGHQLLVPLHAVVPPAGTGELGRGDGPCGHGAGGVRQDSRSQQCQRPEGP